MQLDPAPADVADRLDTTRIEHGLAAYIVHEPDLIEPFNAGALRWSLEGFDEHGLGHVTLLTQTGALVATVEVHWSALVT